MMALAKPSRATLRWVTFDHQAKNGRVIKLTGCVKQGGHPDVWWVEYPYRGKVGMIISHRNHFTEIDMNGNPITQAGSDADD